MFMCSALNVKIKHYTLSGDYDFHIETFHPISPEGPEEELDTLHMLWKPGHYDVLYRKEDMMRDQYEFEEAKVGGVPFAHKPGSEFSKLGKAENAIR